MEEVPEEVDSPDKVGIFANHVGVPDFLIERFRCHGSSMEF